MQILPRQTGMPVIMAGMARRLWPADASAEGNAVIGRGCQECLYKEKVSNNSFTTKITRIYNPRRQADSRENEKY